MPASADRPLSQREAPRKQMGSASSTQPVSVVVPPAAVAAHRARTAASMSDDVFWGNAESAAPPCTGNADKRLEGWSIISKITPFVHAVGRVEDGRGSAILIALPDVEEESRASASATTPTAGRRRAWRPRARRQATPVSGATTRASLAETSRRLGATMNESDASRASALRSGGVSGMTGSVLGGDGPDDFMEGAAKDTAGGAGGGATAARPLAVILTTSSVLSSRQDASGARVTFMEQPVAGTAAQLGHVPQPISLAVRADAGFICSVDAKKRCNRRRSGSDDSSASSSHRNVHAKKSLTAGGMACGLSPSRRPSEFPRGHIGRVSSSSGSSSTDSDAVSPTVPVSPATVPRGSIDNLWDVDDTATNTTGDDVDDDCDDDDAQEIGYALTYCEIEGPKDSPVQPSASTCRSEDSLNMTRHRMNHTSIATDAAYPAGSVLGRTSPSARNADGAWNGGDGGRAASAADRASARRTPGKASAVGDSTASLGVSKKKEDDIFLVKPLPLPLLLSAIQPVRVGDTHLTVTHVDGLERHYVVQRVSAVYGEFCEYADDATLVGDYCSGGPVFNMNGDFIGLQHRVDNDSICMFTRSIVQSLFDAGKLGICRSPIANVLTQEPDAFGDRVVATRDQMQDEAYHRSLHATQSSDMTNLVVEGGRLAKLEDLKWARQIRERPVSLAERKPSYEEVYKEFFTGFSSLTHMLSAFNYCPALVQKALEAMMSPEFRGQLQTAASCAVVGFVLEVLDGFPQVEPLVNVSLSVLSRMCLHAQNLAALVRLDGVPTILEIMKEYAHSPQTLQWGAFCLAHALDTSAPSVEVSVDVLLRCNAVEVAVAALRAYSKKQQHLVRWLCLMLTNIVSLQPRTVTLFIHEDLPQLLLTLVEHYKDDQDILAALLLLLSKTLLPLRGELKGVEDSLDCVGGRGARGAGGLRGADEYAGLKAFVCTSPLSVSAYFLHRTLAEQARGPQDSCKNTSADEQHTTQPWRLTREGTSAPLQRSASRRAVGRRTPTPSPPREGAAAAGEPGEPAWVASNDEGSTPPTLGGWPRHPRTSAETPSSDTPGQPSDHWVRRATVAPSTCAAPSALNLAVASLLEASSREQRSNAVVERIAVCLDVLLVLHEWGLYPFTYVSAATATERPNSDEAQKSRDSPSSIAGGAAKELPCMQEVLDRVHENFFASPELLRRLEELHS